MSNHTTLAYLAGIIDADAMFVWRNAIMTGAVSKTISKAISSPK